MVSQINLGGFTTVNGKTVGNGIASGLDVKSIISAAVAGKQVPVTTLQNTIKADNNKVTAYSTMTTLLTSLNTAAAALSNPPGFDNAANNAFDGRQVFLSTNTGVAGNTYVGVTAAPGATTGQSTITVQNLAVAKSQQTVSFASESASVVEASGGATSGMFSAGTFKINGTDITLNQGDSLAEVAAAINQQTTTTHVQAGIIQVSSTDFRLTLQSTVTGTTNAYTITDPSNVINGHSIFDPAQNVAAVDAGLTFNGIPLTRPTNTIADIVPNVTFTLYSPTPAASGLTPATTVTAEIDNDTTAAATAITNFSTAYNAFMTFVAQQEQRNSDGSYSSTAYLGTESTFQTLASQIQQEVNGAVGGLSQFSDLSAAGISFKDQAATTTTPAVSNIMSVDQTALTTALTNTSATDASGNPAPMFSDIRNLFEFSFNSSSDKLAAYTRTGDVAMTKFTADIDPARTKVDATTGKTVPDQVHITYQSGVDTLKNPVYTTISANYSANSGGGGTITGKAGTPLAGLSMLYASNSAAVITVDQTQGISDKLNALLTGALSSTGIIQTSVQGLTNTNTQDQTQITTLQSQITDYQNTLSTKYARLEAEISKANSILQMLQAQQNAQYGTSSNG